ncbi:hypothetical protein APHAL10511_007996 [Amanita phalloides]|nr:hypothetical protein APHAL10511_007996 [Amanita phalloides]
MFSFHDSAQQVVISNEQAARIVHHHFAEHRNSNIQFDIVPGVYRHANSMVYLIDVLPATQQRIVCFLILSVPGDKSTDGGEDEGEYRCNSLSTVLSLSQLIQDGTDLPIPKYILDTSLSIVPYHYLLSPPLAIPQDRVLISLSEARRESLLSAVEDARIDLRVGQYLGQLHTNVVNEWFGVPEPLTQSTVLNGMKLPSFLTMGSVPPGGDAAYSWQETFVAMFETVLGRVETLLKGDSAEPIVAQDGTAAHPRRVLPSQDIHRYLSRAIGFFLFDDVDVPSLVTHTGSADDIFITLATPSQLRYKDPEALPPTTPPLPDPQISCILPNLAHALWGDPLIEAMFTPPGPSTTVLEGYNGAGGGTLIVFARQKTKRLWYSLFSALLILAEQGVRPLDGAESTVDWAWETVEKCAEALKHAPCY